MNQSSFLSERGKTVANSSEVKLDLVANVLENLATFSIRLLEVEEAL